MTSKTKRAAGGGFITGAVIGLLVGLAVALAVALYVTKTPVPFIDKVPQRTAEQDAAEAARNRNWDPNAPLAGKNPARPAPPAASGMVAGEPAAGASQAEAVLPPTPAPAPPVALPANGAASAAPARAQAAASAPTSTAAASRPSREAARDPAAILAGQSASGDAPAAKPAPRAASAVSTAFFVQAGAYARTDDAEAQRAKLALLGMDARITEREQGGRTVYRVRVGPFDSREPAEDTQTRLAGAGIEANLVRVER
jgi:cell division protein FtsN